MNQRFLMWGLMSIAFVVTLAISSWHDGLWTSDAIPARGNRPVALSSAEPTALPVRSVRAGARGAGGHGVTRTGRSPAGNAGEGATTDTRDC